MPADGVQAAAWGGISARPAGSTDEITSVFAAQKEGENGRNWPGLPHWATREVGSYLGYAGHDTNIVQ
jgi:hypothetical protein